MKIILQDGDVITIRCDKNEQCKYPSDFYTFSLKSSSRVGSSFSLRNDFRATQEISDMNADPFINALFPEGVSDNVLDYICNKLAQSANIGRRRECADFRVTNKGQCLQINGKKINLAELLEEAKAMVAAMKKINNV